VRDQLDFGEESLTDRWNRLIDEHFIVKMNY